MEGKLLTLPPVPFNPPLEAGAESFSLFLAALPESCSHTFVSEAPVLSGERAAGEVSASALKLRVRAGRGRLQTGSLMSM